MIDRDLCGLRPCKILAWFDRGLDTKRMADLIAFQRRGFPAPTEAAIANALSSALTDRRAALDMKQRGSTYAEIGARYGVSKVAIHKRFASMGLTQKRGRPWTAAEVAELTAIWGSCLSPQEIADQLGRTRLAIIGKAERLNLPSMLPRKRARAA